MLGGKHCHLDPFVSHILRQEEPLSKEPHAANAFYISRHLQEVRRKHLTISVIFLQLTQLLQNINFQDKLSFKLHIHMIINIIHFKENEP